MKKNEIVSFADAFKSYWVRAFDFRGVSTRAEFWWPTLAIAAIVGIGMWLPLINVLVMVFGVICIIPSISLTVRRMHDIGRPWGHYFAPAIVNGIFSSVAEKSSSTGFIAMATIISLVITVWLIIWLCTPSKISGNPYRKKVK